MAWFERIPLVTPARGTLIYAVGGSLWILFSDQLVLALAGNERMLTVLQTTKGAAFIAASSILIYGLTTAQYLQREELTRQVRTELQHVSILHRILRHNVRNQCAIISGYLETVGANVPESERGGIEAMQRAVDRLLTLSEKAVRLNRALSEGRVDTRVADVGRLVTDAVETAGEYYPSARLDAAVPAGPTPAVVPTAFDWVLQELLENAIEHNDTPTPVVDVAVTTTDDSVVLTVSDNGPGLPPVEHELSEADPEDPLRHSQGVGLWAVRILTTLAGGTYELPESDAGGARVVLSLPKPDAADPER